MTNSRRIRFGGTVAAGVVTLFALAPVPPATAGTGVPYTDESAQGFIGLCDHSGHLVTHADVAEKPFVWRGVSSVPAPPPYRVRGAKATLYAFQPREGIDPSEWNGLQLTASSTYSDLAHPIAQATFRDFSLSVFLQEYPARWNGFVQLRLYYSAPGAGIAQTPYAAADIQVTGTTWSLIRGGSVACDAGSAFSPESLLPATNRAGLATESPAPFGSANPSTPSSPPRPGSAAPVAPYGATDLAKSRNASWFGRLNTPLLVALGGAVALAAAVGFPRWRTRRRRT